MRTRAYVGFVPANQIEPNVRYILVIEQGQPPKTCHMAVMVDTIDRSKDNYIYDTETEKMSLVRAGSKRMFTSTEKRVVGFSKDSVCNKAGSVGKLTDEFMHEYKHRIEAHPENVSLDIDIKEDGNPSLCEAGHLHIAMGIHKEPGKKEQDFSERLVNALKSQGLDEMLKELGIKGFDEHEAEYNSMSAKYATFSPKKKMMHKAFMHGLVLGNMGGPFGDPDEYFEVLYATKLKKE